MNLLAPITLTVLLVAIAPCGAAETAHGAGPAPPSPTGTNAIAEFTKLEADDDAAQAEVDKWVRENDQLKAKGAGLSETELEHRISVRFEPIHQAYEDFLRRHPTDAHAHLIYGSFLNERQDEHGAQVQWERALELDPVNPAVYNNLAGRYSEGGPVNKAFEYFAKAIELGPTEPLYYHNFADSLFVLRAPAAVYYGISEQQVYGRVLLLYSNALRLDPQNFTFARDVAQTYYSLKPLPIDAALTAWTNALLIARKEPDREDACVHLARVKMLAGRFIEARNQLNAVTNEASLKLKANLLRNIAEREKERP